VTTRPPRWRRELADAIVEPGDLAALRPGLGAEQVIAAIEALPARVPREYAALIDPSDSADPIAAMVAPDPRELQPSAVGSDDPLCEERDSPVRGLVHRYPDRVLLTVTGRCASYCRFCMRRRLVGRRLRDRDAAWLAQVVDYLREHPGVREVILSGGDPLVLSDGRLAAVLEAVRTVRHVELVRVDTRVPVVLPSRITADLVGLLRRYGPLWVVTHFNHPRELTPAALGACATLIDGGLPVANQAVLLAGVNDRNETVEALCRGLLRARIQPYYLHQCDLVAGASHFRTPLAVGAGVVDHVCGRIAGFGIAGFVVDTPGGHGKVAVSAQALLGRDGDVVSLRAPDGALVHYPDIPTNG